VFPEYISSVTLSQKIEKPANLKVFGGNGNQSA